ncbi:MAG: serine/threonine protein kinase [Ignavibacteriales bacterium]|nr:serine/threonine protein kinase [Ignavibacteriales bacterium]
MKSSKNSTVLFEKFEILETLKKDEFSAVYLVKHHYLGITLILKTLDTTHSPDESILERFKREAKILARIKHPNIINVVDFGFAGEFFYISVEYFESQNLREIIKRGNLTEDQKQRLVVQLLQGLEAAHAAQVIHRDIKPENILVNKKFELKIADFGLAFPENELMVTKKSSIVGTPSYMSPEQIMGEDLTVQSDLFSAGIVAYEICSKINPFIKADINATINSILTFEPQQLTGWADVPVALVEPVQKMLQRNKSKRMASCAEALSYFPESSTSKDSPRTGKIIPGKFLYMIIGLLFILSIAVYFFLNKPVAGSVAQLKDSTAFSADTAVLSKAARQNNQNLLKPATDSGSPVKNISSTPQMADTPEGAGQATPNGGVFLVNLVIDCSPWANVFIDSARMDVTPIRESMRLTAGKHTIRFINPDYPAYSTVFTVNRDGLQSFKLNLDTLVAKISFQVFPWGEVYVDGKFFGVTPMKNAIQVSPGKHTIQFKNPGYSDFSEKMTFKSGEVRQIEYNFEKNQQKRN